MNLKHKINFGAQSLK